jgi:hypothetical protein
MKKRNSKKGNILTENVIFIVLNLIFLTILLLFLFSKMGDVGILEEKTAKQIALIIDSAKPGMEISLSIKDAVEKANKENWEGKIVFIEGNIVTVQLKEGTGYSYSFFNDVELSKNYHYANEGNEYEFKIEKYKQVGEAESDEETE